MNNYIYLNSDKNGVLAVSSYVVKQIAEDTINNLFENELKGQFALKMKNKKCQVRAVVNKTNIQVNCEIIAIEGVESHIVSSKLQKAITNNIYSSLEISKVQVNVTIVGILKDVK